MSAIASFLVWLEVTNLAIQWSTICHPDEQCGVRLRRVGPLSLGLLEAGFCQQQSCIIVTDLGRSLWRSGGEEDENFLEEGNCGDLLVLALTDTDTVESIGSSRRGFLL